MWSRKKRTAALLMDMLEDRLDTDAIVSQIRRNHSRSRSWRTEAERKTSESEQNTAQMCDLFYIFQGAKTWMGKILTGPRF
ncbi:hypothetical protein Y032_0129g1508 [Ancylostoma ceylanicum]|uniref:Uncharacterized protein n=1 Tax=Ancylostoma ceylanicum TaxID=53326 RepID=A0A016T7I6_9BILA|nr:hypothetical protein Y032_0129g1508 [Ancylostoma ceylanicum]